MDAAAAVAEHTWQGSCCLECEADVSWCDNPPVTFIQRGDTPNHVCKLPYSKEINVNAEVKCNECGKLSVAKTDPDAWGDYKKWVPLRWWHFKAKKNLRSIRVVLCSCGCGCWINRALGWDGCHGP